MMKISQALVLNSVLLGVVTFATSASAEQPKTRADLRGDYGYEFEDDPIAASGDVAQGLRIAVRPLGQRSLLIRPRTQFIQELFKSAENL